MRGQRLGMLSLRLDAVYCLVLGTVVAVALQAISATVALPTVAILAAGVAVVLWAGLVEWMRATLDLRLTLRIVMIANITATLVVALASFAAAALSRCSRSWRWRLISLCSRGARPSPSGGCARHDDWLEQRASPR